jgi:hypothetical protein
MTAAGVSTRECLSTGELERRLHNKYHGEDFALCFDVRNSAGFNATRACDALGIGLWPSRGCHLYGFEIKASRSDWLRELKEAAKAEAFVPYCDYWFIVAGSRDIIKAEELPPGWGLIVPRGDGLNIQVAATLNAKPLPMPRGMLAAFVKRAATQNPNAGVLKQTYDKGFESGKERGKAIRLSDDGGGERYKSLRAQVDKFKTDTGIDLGYFYDAPQLLKAMAYVKAGRRLGRTAPDLRTVAHQLHHALTGIEDAAKLIEQVSHEMATELAKP